MAEENAEQEIPAETQSIPSDTENTEAEADESNTLLEEQNEIPEPPFEEEVLPPSEEVPEEPELPLPMGFSTLIINEVNLEAEFIELYNSGNEVLNLSQMQFSELSGSNEKRHDFADFLDRSVISPNEFVLISLSRTLNDSGETVKLYEDSNAVEPFQELVIPEKETGKSYSRNSDGSFIWTIPTPGVENFSEPNEEENGGNDDEETLPPANFSQLFINEIDLEAEFIELYNPGAETLDVSLVEFSELSGVNEVRHKVTDFSTSTSIEPAGFLLLTMDRKLNNSGETIRLYSDENSVEPLQEVVIPLSESGKSYNRKEDGTFVWSDPTPGTANTFPEENNEDEGNYSPPDITFLVVNEVNSQAEFIELKNIGTEAMDIRTLQFSELSGANEVRHDFANFGDDFLVAPGDFFVLNFSNKLNNTGDTLRLYINDGAIEPFFILEIPNSKTGQSYMRNVNDSFVWTTTPTPGAENILTVPPTSSSGNSGKTTAKKQDGFFADEPKLHSTMLPENVQIHISEVAIKNSKHDMIELSCLECGTVENPADLAGLRLFDDHVFFEFPPETFVHSGDFIVLALKSAEEKREQTAYGWIFFISHKGLTATDETLMLLDSNDHIVDGLCWTDWNGKFSSGEEKDVGVLKAQGQVADERHREYDCFPSQSISGAMSIARKFHIDTNSAEDFFPTIENTFGSANPAAPLRTTETNLLLDTVQFFPNGAALLSIFNAGEQTINTAGFFLRNEEKKIIDLPNQQIEPNSSAFVFLKKLPAGENILLELSDAWGATTDVVCINAGGPSESWFQEALREFHRIGQWRGRDLADCITLDPNVTNHLQRISIKDTNQAEDFTAMPTLAQDMATAKELAITAVSPNPEGKDKGNEWLEISAREDISDLSTWFLGIGEKLITLPRTALLAGESVIFPSADFTLPTLKNNAGSVQLFSPHGEIFTLAWDKAKDGAVLRLEEGELFWEEPIVAKETKTKATKEDLEKEKSQAEYGDSITVEIVAVTPNPKGSDSGQEKVVLKNISGHDGFWWGWKWGNAKTTKLVVPTFFTAGEEKTFIGKNLFPQLKNTDGIFLLIDATGTIVDQLAWPKSGDDQIITKETTWEQTTQKKISAAKKSTSSKTAAVQNSPKILYGILESFSTHEVHIRNEQGEIRAYVFDKKNPQQQFFLEQVLAIGEEVGVVLSDEEEIIGFDLVRLPKMTLLKTLSPIHSSGWLVVLFVIIAFSSAVFVGTKKFKPAVLT